MYFLQKDDIMLHFTQKGSSDITGFQCLLICLLGKCTVDKRKVEILQNFVAFSEYTNFTRAVARLGVSEWQNGS